MLEKSNQKSLMTYHFFKYYSSTAIKLYIGLLVIVSIVFVSNMMPLVWCLFGLIEVIGFFYFSFLLISKKWLNSNPVVFLRNIFWSTLIIRLSYIIIIYYYYDIMNGYPFEFGDSLDSLPYYNEGVWLAEMIKQGDLSSYWRWINSQQGISDFGYPFLVGCLNWLSEDSIIFHRFFNALFDAFSVVLIYKLAKRNFGEWTGRLSGIFVMLMPNMIYYSGLTMKESLMCMLGVLFIERADFLFRLKKISLWQNIYMILIGFSLFCFRTVLGVSAFLALFSAIAFSSNRLVSSKKKIVLGFFLIAVLSFAVGDTLKNEVMSYYTTKMEIESSVNLDWRSQRAGGNKLVKYISSSVFLPLIVTIPFPTMVNIPGQENHMMIHGGNYIKNILSFFALLACFLLIKQKKWRFHLMPLSFMYTYLLILALSNFAHSGRFHMPAMPFLLMFSAYGISRMQLKYKMHLVIFLFFISVTIIFWSWFKLAGRGLL